jgi:hypothetical protein
MSKLLLALVLAASTDAFADHPGSDDEWDAREHHSCSTDVSVVDRSGRLREAHRVSASVVPSLVIRGRVSPRDEDAPALLFDVYSPRGRRYQVLLATPLVTATERNGQRFERVSRTQEATLAVAGSSIAFTSLYGRWRVEPRLEGESRPCGRPEYFTIRP